MNFWTDKWQVEFNVTRGQFNYAFYTLNLLFFFFKKCEYNRSYILFQPRRRRSELLASRPGRYTPKQIFLPQAYLQSVEFVLLSRYSNWISPLRWCTVFKELFVQNLSLTPRCMASGHIVKLHGILKFIKRKAPRHGRFLEIYIYIYIYIKVS